MSRAGQNARYPDQKQARFTCCGDRYPRPGCVIPPHRSVEYAFVVSPCLASGSSTSLRQTSLVFGLISFISLLLLTYPGRGLAKKPSPPKWVPLQSGLDYVAVTLEGRTKLKEKVQDTKLHVIRIDPLRATLLAIAASALDKKGRSAAQWSKKHRLAVVTNAGMYYGNHLTHVGYLRVGQHLNRGRWHPDYASLLVLDPQHGRPPRATILDRESLAQPLQLEMYGSVVQNLRLLRSKDGRRGENVWSPKTANRRWSEAALGLDRAGRIYFFFCRAPLSMWQFNELLLGLPWGIIRAMHLEGGPEASLSIHAGKVHLDLSGSFETGFFFDDSNSSQWFIPNILGVARK